MATRKQRDALEYQKNGVLIKAVAEEKFHGSHVPKSREVRSSTCEVLGAATTDLGTQSILLGAPGY